jgi:hypothetical protein
VNVLLMGRAGDDVRVTGPKETGLHRHGDTVPPDVVSTGWSYWGCPGNLVRRTRTIVYIAGYVKVKSEPSRLKESAGVDSPIVDRPADSTGRQIVHGQ